MQGMWQQPPTNAFVLAEPESKRQQPARAVTQLGLTPQQLALLQQTVSSGSGEPSQLTSSNTSCLQHLQGGTGQVQSGQLLAQLQGPDDLSSRHALSNWNRLGQIGSSRSSERALHLQQQCRDWQNNQPRPLDRLAQDAATLPRTGKQGLTALAQL